MIAKRFLTLTAITLVLSACQRAPAKSAVPVTTALAPTSTAPVRAPVAPTANLVDGCVDTFDPNVDYFPEKATLKMVTGLKIDYFKNYKVVTVSTPWPGADKAFQYVLVQCGTPAPINLPNALVVNVPAKTLVQRPPRPQAT